MTVVRQQGQLVETTGDDAAKLATLQGIPVTPTSPAAGAAIGANPDSAKMLGSSANKQAVVADQTKPADTLQTAERTATARTQSTAAEDQSASKASQLQSLGSLQTRVQALINNDLKLQAPAQAQVNQDQLATLSGTDADKAKAQELIQRVTANPSDTATVAEATQFWTDHGWGDINTFTPQAFISTAAQSLGQQAAGQVQDQVTLKDVGISDAEGANLTATFGDDSWKGLTVPQLSQKIEELRQAEFNRVGGLKASLATAQGAQRQQILSELADLGQTGVTGTEQGMQGLAQQVTQADTVQVGGEQHKVEDLLKDASISDLVTRMLGDPQLSAEVAKTNPEFATWVQTNQKALQQLSSSVANTTAQVQGINAQKRQLATVGGGSLTDSVMNLLVPGWNKVSGSVPDVSQVGVLNALKDPALDSKTQKGMTDALNSVANSDPGKLKQLTAMGADDFKSAYSYAQQLAQDPTGGLLKDLTGADASGGFVTSPADQKALAKYKAVTDALGSNPALLVDYTDPTLKPMLLDMIKSGQFTTADVALLAKDPSRLAAYSSYHQVYDKIANATDIGSALNAVFGHTVDVNQINTEYKLALDQAKYDPTGPAAAKAQAFKANLDLNNDGVVDDKDLASLKGKVDLPSFEQVLGGTTLDNSTITGATKAQLGAGTLDSADSFYTKAKSILADNKVSEAELGSLSDAERAKFFAANPKAKDSSGGTWSQDRWAQLQQSRASEKEYNDALTSITDDIGHLTQGNGTDVLDQFDTQVRQNGKALDNNQLQTLTHVRDALQATKATGRGKEVLSSYLTYVNSLLTTNQKIVDTHQAEMQKMRANSGSGFFGLPGGG